jgi:hypothetical protein
LFQLSDQSFELPSRRCLADTTTSTQALNLKQKKTKAQSPTPKLTTNVQSAQLFLVLSQRLMQWL